MIHLLLDINFNNSDSNDALWTLAGVIIGAILTGSFTYLTQERQFKHNKEMFFLQNKSKEEAKDYLEELLNHLKFTDRKFSTLKKRIGAFTDDEVRQMLLEIGAIKSENSSKEEIWYLRSREENRPKSIPKGYK